MISIPYGKTRIACHLTPKGLLTSRIEELASDKAGIDLVRDALDNPIGSKPLHELAAGKKTCTIIISDHTRPVPSRDILPPMLEELRRGNPDIAVTLLVATGFHRPTTTAELEAKLGAEIAEKEKIVVHDAFDADSNVQIGILPSGAPLVIDRVAVETDLLISEGFIEPHFFAGFSGGRKSVLPGVCDKTTVLGNHCGQFIASPYARTGILEGNPLHRDMVAAAELAKLAFIVNVVINDDKKTVAAFAGDFPGLGLVGLLHHHLHKFRLVQIGINLQVLALLDIHAGADDELCIFTQNCFLHRVLLLCMVLAILSDFTQKVNDSCIQFKNGL